MKNGGGILRKDADEAEKQADRKGRELAPRMVVTRVRNTVNLRCVVRELADVLDSGRTSKRRGAVVPSCIVCKYFLKPGFRHVENWKTRYLDFKKIDDLESGFHFNHDTG